METLNISLDTLIGCSQILGHRLEDRSSIRAQHDLDLLIHLENASSAPLRGESQMHLFSVAPLDVLVTDSEVGKKFHIIELNGTGIGGLVNMPLHRVDTVLENIGEFVCSFDRTAQAPVVLVAVSGKESESSPRLNKMVYEKVLYVEYLRRQLKSEFGEVKVTCAARLSEDRRFFDENVPVVVLGYMKELLDLLSVDSSGRLLLFDRVVSAAVNDRFCMNIVQKFQGAVDLAYFRTLNRCFLAGGDKGVAYALLDDFISQRESKTLSRHNFSRVQSRGDLIQYTLDAIRSGRKIVIKPQGTGLGHGIEFFMRADEPEDAVVRRIDASLKQTEEYYNIVGGAFPYTISDFIDTCTIKDPQSEFYGHKYELRIIVYRDGRFLRAFPSIIKISSKVYRQDAITRDMLINNITASSAMTKTSGTDHMLSLCNWKTLEILGVSFWELADLCRDAVGYVRYVIDRLEDEPQWFGLPVVEPRHYFNQDAGVAPSWQSL